MVTFCNGCELSNQSIVGPTFLRRRRPYIRESVHDTGGSGKIRPTGCFAVIYENSPNGRSKCTFRTIPGKLIKELSRLFKFNPFVSFSKGPLPQISKNFFLVVVIYRRKDPGAESPPPYVTKRGEGRGNPHSIGVDPYIRRSYVSLYCLYASVYWNKPLSKIYVAHMKISERIFYWCAGGNKITHIPLLRPFKKYEP